MWYRPPLDIYWPVVDHKTAKMDLTSTEPNLNMQNREVGPIESEFWVKNTLSTTLDTYWPVIDHKTLNIIKKSIA